LNKYIATSNQTGTETVKNIFAKMKEAQKELPELKAKLAKANLEKGHIYYPDTYEIKKLENRIGELESIDGTIDILKNMGVK